MEDERIAPLRVVLFVFLYFGGLLILALLVFKLVVFRPDGPASTVDRLGAVSPRVERAQSGAGDKVAAKAGSQSSPNHSQPRRMTLQGPKPKAVLVKTDRGSFTITLLWKSAPGTAANFVTLVRKHFYDGTRFHFVGAQEVIGGDPNTRNADPGDDGKGGPGYTNAAEFNLRPHVKGTVGMVRGGDPNSAGSQFYVTLAPVPERNGRYAVFGQVDEGLDVLYKIRKGDKFISARLMR